MIPSSKNTVLITKEFIEGLARVRGVQVNEAFAEAFEVKDSNCRCSETWNELYDL